MIGKTLAHYRITEKVGEGGMGVVYKATDTKLGRQVALKVLPKVFADDPQRLARFEREARLLAALNHTHIAAIYGLEKAESTLFLVLELVPGETLADRLDRGRFAIEDALDVARQMTEALEYAHEQGIIHRDLKPANIKLTPDGKVKILDFGLAKALEGDVAHHDLSHSPTITAAATQGGVVLGTAAYMGPEQARGQEVDKRADIWGFGCVLYEMLTGNQTFRGETVSDTLAAVLKTEPDWDAIPAGTPAGIRRLLRRCLQKNAKIRLRDIGEARIAIEAAVSGSEEEELGLPAAFPQQPRSSSIPLRIGAIAAAVVLGAVVVWIFTASRDNTPLRKFVIVDEHLQAAHDNRPVISPDGKRIVYTSAGKLWLRGLDQLEPRELPGTEGGKIPFWSPDSASVGYVADNELWRIPVGGGEKTLLSGALGVSYPGSGATRGAEGRAVYSLGSTGLMEVSTRGGDPRSLLKPVSEVESDFHQPHFLPGGRDVLFVVHRLRHGPDTIELLSGNARTVILQLEGQSLWSPVYSPTGHILYRRHTSNPGLWALPFSLSALEATGEPFLLMQDGNFPSVSSEGTLVYVQGASAGLQQLVWVNRQGEIEDVVGQPQQDISQPALSPNGDRVVVMAKENENWDIWVHDINRRTRTRFTFDPVSDWDPGWSPDGKKIVFWGAAASTLSLRAADGTGELETLLPKGENGEPHFSPDGNFLAYTDEAGATGFDLWYLPLEGERTPVAFLQTSAQETQARISPDSQYVAYVSDESGRLEVYIKRFPSGEGKWQLSVQGGNWPRWSADGKRLFYKEDDTIMEVEYELTPSLSLGTPQRLFSGQTAGVLMFEPKRYDVSDDGERFVMVQKVEQEDNTASIVVVQNWIAEFEDKR